MPTPIVNAGFKHHRTTFGRFSLRSLTIMLLFSPALLNPVYATSVTPSVAKPAAMSPQGDNAANTALNQRLNINIADAQTISDMLSGIGINKAKAIVAYRDTHGDFIALEELLAVKGIGEKILTRNRDKMRLK